MIATPLLVNALVQSEMGTLSFNKLSAELIEVHSKPHLTAVLDE